MRLFPSIDWLTCSCSIRFLVTVLLHENLGLIIFYPKGSLFIIHYLSLWSRIHNSFINQDRGFHITRIAPMKFMYSPWPELASIRTTTFYQIAKSNVLFSFQELTRLSPHHIIHMVLSFCKSFIKSATRLAFHIKS